MVTASEKEKVCPRVRADLACLSSFFLCGRSRLFHLPTAFTGPCSPSAVERVVRSLALGAITRRGDPHTCISLSRRFSLLMSGCEFLSGCINLRQSPQCQLWGQEWLMRPPLPSLLLLPPPRPSSSLLLLHPPPCKHPWRFPLGVMKPAPRLRHPHNLFGAKRSLGTKTSKTA